MDDKTDLKESGICDWINAYLRDEIDAEEFANLVILNHFYTWDISLTLKGTIRLLTYHLFTKKPFLPQERKQVKELLKKAVEIYNKSDKTDKTDEVEPIIEEICKIV